MTAWGGARLLHTQLRDNRWQQRGAFVAFTSAGWPKPTEAASARRALRNLPPPPDTLGGPVRRRAKPGVARGKPQRWRGLPETRNSVEFTGRVHSGLSAIRIAGVCVCTRRVALQSKNFVQSKLPSRGGIDNRIKTRNSKAVGLSHDCPGQVPVRAADRRSGRHRLARWTECLPPPRLAAADRLHRGWLGHRSTSFGV